MKMIIFTKKVERPWRGKAKMPPQQLHLKPQQQQQQQQQQLWANLTDLPTTLKMKVWIGSQVVPVAVQSHFLQLPKEFLFWILMVGSALLW